MQKSTREARRRLDKLENEAERRRTPSQIQAEYAITADNREEETDDRPDEELSTSELQARAAAQPHSRGGRQWKNEDGRHG